MELHRHEKFPLLDPMRALAAISILIVHTAYFSKAHLDAVYGQFLAHLDIGVPFFFLLSAFLLYRPFVVARVEDTERTPFWEYAKRRFVRIAPAYWAALTIAAIIPGLAGAFSGNWWVYYGLLQSFPVYDPTGTCAVDPFRCGIPVAWSLTVEVLFYVLLPFIVLAMAWLGSRWRGRPLTLEFGLVAVLTAVSIWIQGSVPIGDAHTFLFFSPFGRGWWFGLGLALAAISVHVARRRSEPAAIDWVRRHPGVPVICGIAIYAIVVVTILGPTPSLAFPVIEIKAYLAQYLLFGVIAALILLPAIFGTDGGGLTRRVLAHRSLVWLGLISYGIFLWQFPVLILVFDDVGIQGFLPLTVMTLGLTIACAAASYYLLERPLMRRVRSRRGAGGAAFGSAGEELAALEAAGTATPASPPTGPRASGP
jgi:peptidoglycan/LPS O-acetylase OafA/YrhL